MPVYGNWKNFTTKDGLPSDKVYCVRIDGDRCWQEHMMDWLFMKTANGKHIPQKTDLLITELFLLMSAKLQGMYGLELLAD